LRRESPHYRGSVYLLEGERSLWKGLFAERDWCPRTTPRVRESNIGMSLYFNAFNRALKRDLYRPAVFLCNTPFWMALSRAETVWR
jgi:hypothetical protein